MENQLREWTGWNINVESWQFNHSLMNFKLEPPIISNWSEFVTNGEKIIERDQIVMYFVVLWSHIVRMRRTEWIYGLTLLWTGGGRFCPPPWHFMLWSPQYWSEGSQILVQFIFCSYNVSWECLGTKGCPRKKLECDFWGRGQHPKVQNAKKNLKDIIIM